MGIIEFYRKGRPVIQARWYLRTATRIGNRVRLWGEPYVDNQGQLFIGDRVRMFSKITAIELAVGPKGRLEIGEGTFINYGCSIAATLSVCIGPECNLGTYVNIMDNNFHSLKPELRKEIPLSVPVILEGNVWLGTRVIVLPGVTIGEGSVIGAGSVVTSTIPPRSMAAGVPARVIRKL